MVFDHSSNRNTIQSDVPGHWTDFNLGPEGAQFYLESYKRDPNLILSAHPAQELDWTASEGWELYANFEDKEGYHYLVEKRIQ